jgi:hypothetical protein
MVAHEREALVVINAKPFGQPPDGITLQVDECLGIPPAVEPPARQMVLPPAQYQPGVRVQFGGPQRRARSSVPAAVTGSNVTAG